MIQSKTHINNIMRDYDLKLIHNIKYAKYNCTHVLFRFEAFGEITYTDNKFDKS